MKKYVVLLVVCVLTAMSVNAQNYMVVNTESVFKSIKEYDDAMTSLDEMAEKYQKQVDAAFEEVEKMFNNYQAQKAYLSQSTREQREDEIINREKEINRFQEQVFGQDGELMKKRIELIKPIQDKVFNAINNYAQLNNYELVLDIAANPMVLYYSPSADKTNAIIALVK